MEKIYLKLVLAGLLGLFPVICLVWIYQSNQHADSYNFKRKIIYNFDSRVRLDIKFNSYYLAGYVNGSIYLGNVTLGQRLLKIDTTLKKIREITITPDDPVSNHNGLFKTTIDSNRYYFANGETMSSYSDTVENWRPKADKIFVPFFKTFIPLKSGSRVYTYVSADTRQNSLLKVYSSGQMIENNKVLEKQVDGIFCTAGTLDYNKRLNVLTYVYTYRNEILVVDTNLQLVKKIKTIDPIDSARFKVSTIKSTNSSVLTSEPVVVNTKSFNWKQYLFVQSNIRGMNEDLVRFKHSAVIDIYDLQLGKYIYSVYIGNPDGVPVTQLKIFNDYLYALSSHFIYKYKIALPRWKRTTGLLSSIKTN